MSDNAAIVIVVGMVLAVILVVSGMGWDIASDNNNKARTYHKDELAACVQTDQDLACIQFVVTAHNDSDRR